MVSVFVGNSEAWNTQSQIEIPVMVSSVNQQIPGVDLYAQTSNGLPFSGISVTAAGTIFSQNNIGGSPWFDGSLACDSTITAAGEEDANGVLGFLQFDPLGVRRGVYGVTLHDIEVNGMTFNTDFADLSIVPTFADGSITILGYHDVIWDGKWSGDLPLTLDEGASVFVRSDLTIDSFKVYSLVVGSGAVVAEPSTMLIYVSGFFVLSASRAVVA